MAHCETNSILASYPPGIKINPLKCKRWTCPECKHSRSSRLRHEAHRGLPNTFLTLTVNPKWGVSKDHRARSLKEAWTRIHRKAKKEQHKEELEYLCVFEVTKAGEPHLHVLCRSSWIDQKWLSDQMKAEMDAPIVDIRRVNNPKKAATYVAKYVSKQPEKFPGTKRYWRSLHYFCLPKEEWEDPLPDCKGRQFAFGLPDEIARRMKRLCYKLEVLNLPEGTEYWLVDDFPKLTREGKDPPESQQELFRSASPGAPLFRG